MVLKSRHETRDTNPRGAARRAQMLFPVAPLHGTCTITWQRTRVLHSTSTVRVIVAHRTSTVVVSYCARIKRGAMSSISPMTSYCFSYCFVIISCNQEGCNSTIIFTRQHDAIARWRLNPCDQAGCLLTSYRVITH